MEIRKSIIFILSVSFTLCTSSSWAQATSQLGISVGPVAFQSDYGERDDFETNSNNVGYGIALSYYVDWGLDAPRRARSIGDYLAGHFKVRAEFNYHQTELAHYGQYVEGTGPLPRNLRAMTGETSVFEFGPHFEWHPRMIRDYNYMRFNLDYWFGLGFHYVSFKPDAQSSLGDLGSDNFITPDPFQDGGIDTARDQTIAFVFDLGVSYRFDENSDILLMSKWHAYGSNFVDGLSPQGPQNEANDWIWWVSLGYRYTFD